MGIGKRAPFRDRKRGFGGRSSHKATRLHSETSTLPVHAQNRLAGWPLSASFAQLGAYAALGARFNMTAAGTVGHAPTTRRCCWGWGRRTLWLDSFRRLLVSTGLGSACWQRSASQEMASACMAKMRGNPRVPMKHGCMCRVAACINRKCLFDSARALPLPLPDCAVPATPSSPLC